MSDLIDKIIQLNPEQSPLYDLIKRIKKKQALNKLKIEYGWLEDDLVDPRMKTDEAILRYVYGECRDNKLYSVKEILAKEKEANPFDYVKVQ